MPEDLRGDAMHREGPDEDDDAPSEPPSPEKPASAAFATPRTEHLHPLPANGNGQKKPSNGSANGNGTVLLDRVQLARLKGYEGDPCTECGQLTMVGEQGRVSSATPVGRRRDAVDAAENFAQSHYFLATGIYDWYRQNKVRSFLGESGAKVPRRPADTLSPWCSARWPRPAGLFPDRTDVKGATPCSMASQKRHGFWQRCGASNANSAARNV